jgi:putative hemin transport protein
MRPKRIREEFSRLLEAQPEAGLRKSAAQLKITEAELVAAHSGEGPVIRLNDDYEGQLNGLKKLGEVVAVTRSPHVIHEVRGCYPDARIFGKQGLMVSDTIDLRLRMDHWAADSQFALTIADKLSILMNGDRRCTGSLRPMHPILPPGRPGKAPMPLKSNHRYLKWPWWTRLRKTKQSNLSRSPIRNRKPETRFVKSSERMCVRAWDALKDAHDFIPMLDHLGIERLAALRLAGEPYARRLSKEALIRLLKQAQKTALPIMVFAYSRGCTQIYSGILGQVEEFGEWLNVLDPGFNLHLDIEGGRHGLVRLETQY